MQLLKPTVFRRQEGAMQLFSWDNIEKEEAQ